MFSFLRYINPTFYYNLKPIGSRLYWPDVDLLPDAERLLLVEPDCYSSAEVGLLDLSYQAWLKGIIVDKNNCLNDELLVPTLEDEYCFVLRHFNPVWLLFIFFFRIIEMNNPLSELWALRKALGTKRVNPFSKTKDWSTLINNFDSPLLKSRPKVSIIIPTLNRYRYLRDALQDLENQNYENFEVLVVDQSAPFDENFYRSFELDLKVWSQDDCISTQ